MKLQCSPEKPMIPSIWISIALERFNSSHTVIEVEIYVVYKNLKLKKVSEKFKQLITTIKVSLVVNY